MSASGPRARRPKWLLDRFVPTAELIRLLRGDQGPHWTEVDHWRHRRREATRLNVGNATPDILKVVSDWAEAAGGVLADEGGRLRLRLPVGLPERLARAEMVDTARHYGVEVVIGVGTPP